MMSCFKISGALPFGGDSAFLVNCPNIHAARQFAARLASADARVRPAKYSEAFPPSDARVLRPISKEETHEKPHEPK